MQVTEAKSKIEGAQSDEFSSLATSSLDALESEIGNHCHPNEVEARNRDLTPTGKPTIPGYTRHGNPLSPGWPKSSPGVQYHPGRAARVVEARVVEAVTTIQRVWRVWRQEHGQAVLRTREAIWAARSRANPESKGIANEGKPHPYACK